MREPLVELYVKCFDLSEEERDHGLGAVETTFGPDWFSKFLTEVLTALGTVMTDEERQEADRRLF